MWCQAGRVNPCLKFCCVWCACAVQYAAAAESFSASQRARIAAAPATAYLEYEGITLLDLISKMRELEEAGVGACHLG
jgi:hypothetical protein